MKLYYKHDKAKWCWHLHLLRTVASLIQCVKKEKGMKKMKEKKKRRRRRRRRTTTTTTITTTQQQHNRQQQQQQTDTCHRPETSCTYWTSSRHSCPSLPTFIISRPAIPSWTSFVIQLLALTVDEGLQHGLYFQKVWLKDEAVLQAW